MIPLRRALSIRATRGWGMHRCMCSPPEASQAKGSRVEVNPFDYVRGDLSAISEHIHRMRLCVQVEQDHPVVNTAAKYLLNLGGKRFRPVVVLLMGYVSMEDTEAAAALHKQPKSNLDFIDGPECFKRQIRLAEISELIHTASLIHDDILDNSSTRRGSKSLHTVVGNKVAVLAGDFLLARACKWLTTLEDHKVTCLMARVVEDLTLGEIIQMERMSDMDTYHKKNYYKTASLIAHSAQCAALLSGSKHDQAAFSYGQHLGVAFQTMDDVLDWTASPSELGKPAAMSDLAQGNITLPVLLAAQRVARVDTLVRKKFLSDEEIQYIADTVRSEGMIDKAVSVAEDEVYKAIEALAPFPDSPAKDGLVALAKKSVARSS